MRRTARCSTSSISRNWFEIQFVCVFVQFIGVFAIETKAIMEELINGAISFNKYPKVPPEATNAMNIW